MTTLLRPSRSLVTAFRLQPVLAAGLVLLLLGAITWTAGASAKSRLIRAHPAPGALVDVGGYLMHIDCRGQGSPAVILEAGLDDFSVMWSRVQPDTAQFTRVCAYDRAGTGWSQSSPHPRTIETMAWELHALLTNGDVEPPYVLVGHSFGGALVRQYAHTYPGDVAGLILVDATPAELFTRIPAWHAATDQMLGLSRALAPLSASGLLALVPQAIPNRGLPDEALAQYRAIAATTPYFTTGIAEREAFEANLAALRTIDSTGFGGLPLVVVSRGVWEPLPNISAAENEQAWQTWQVMQSELVSLSANSQQIVAKQSGHSIQLQQPELVIGVIQEAVAADRK